MRSLTLISDAYQLARRSNGPPRPKPKAAWLRLTVTGRTEESDEVISLRLTSPDGAALPRWRPGSHLRIELPSGRIRHYSLCGSPVDRFGYRVAVRRIDGGGGGSAEIHRDVHAGTTLRVMRPRNGFPFAADRGVLFIAGGIGITPILPMAREAAARGLDWRLVYSGRSRSTMPFIDEVRAIGPARASIRADDEAGVPDSVDLVGYAPAGAAIYCCGPPPMIEGVRAIAPGAFHFERFTAAPIADGEPFTVELSHSGISLDVPADRSALDVLLDRDRGLPYSCKQGFCGTCTQRVLGGVVDHRDRRLTDAERAAGDMLICVSRAAAGERLVLDL